MDEVKLTREQQTTRLLNNLRNGQEGAFSELFDLYSDQLLRIIRFRIDRRLAARLDAEDVLQEAFLAGQKRTQNLIDSPAGSFLIWIRMIVRQTMVDLYRHHIGAQRRSANREQRDERKIFYSDESFSMATLLVARNRSPSSVFSEKEIISQVEECLEKLAENDREIIALRHFEELGNSEVAEVLEISQKNASIRYVRALAKLKAALVAVSDSNGLPENFF